MNSLTNETLEFLWHSYLGVSVQNAKTMDTNQLMLICAEKAYLDMNRTLSFKSEDKTPIEWEDTAWIRIAEKVNGI